MRTPAQVGIVGCGVISRAYAANAAAFDTFEIVACADLEPVRCAALAAAHALGALSVEELLASPSIDVVLNLTPPLAHMAVTRSALEAGKHVYSEKPLAITAADALELVQLAEKHGLRIGCAPDIFLGRAYQTAGRCSTRARSASRSPRRRRWSAAARSVWHPDPDIFFGNGAGPLLDMGPYYLTAIVSLLGPVRRVAGFASTFVTERRIEVGPRTGELFAAETPTHTAAVLELEGGLPATLIRTSAPPVLQSVTFALSAAQIVQNKGVGKAACPLTTRLAGRLTARRP